MKDFQTDLEEMQLQLRAAGWPQAAVAVFAAEAEQFSKRAEQAACFHSSLLFGSPLFQRMWTVSEKKATPQQSRELLKLALRCLHMPFELSGSSAETGALLDRIFPDLAPHAAFWIQFSKTLQKAFPAESFAERGGAEELKCQLHQFRYVISCQQAQWVRDRFRGPGMTDAEALAAYFKAYPNLPYSFSESSRLHNKACIDETGQAYYPGGASQQANIKILLHFHTEFILDRKGRFLNILDPEGPSQNGLINGASFNYGDRNRLGNQASHTRYDVKTPAIWDPHFRRLAVKNGGRKFKSPQNNRGPLGYRSAKSLYAPNGRSTKQTVDLEIRRFKSLLGRPLIFLRLWGWLRRLWPWRKQT